MRANWRPVRQICQKRNIGAFKTSMPIAKPDMMSPEKRTRQEDKLFLRRHSSCSSLPGIEARHTSTGPLRSWITTALICVPMRSGSPMPNGVPVRYRCRRSSRLTTGSFLFVENWLRFVKSWRRSADWCAGGRRSGRTFALGVLNTISANDLFRRSGCGCATAIYPTKPLSLRENFRRCGTALQRLRCLDEN